jgi:autotransporter translocation and assembly factor TamB
MARPARKRPLWRRVLRKLVKGLLYLVLVLVVVVVATLLWLRRPSGLDFLRRQVLQRTASIVPGLGLERIEGDLTRTLALHGVVLNDRFGGPCLRVQRIAVRYQLARLLRGVIAVEELELDRPELLVRPSRSGALNLAELVVPSKEEKPPSGPTTLRLALSRLVLRGGRVELGGATGPLLVEGLELDLGVEGGIKDAALELRRLAARVRLPDGRRLQGSVSGRAAIDAERLEAKLAARAGGLLPSGELALELSASGPHSRVKLGARVDAADKSGEGRRGAPKGRLAADGWAGLDANGRPAYDLALKLTDLVPDELVPALRPTRLDLELECAGEGIPLQPGSQARVTLRVPPATVRGLRLDGVTLRARTKGPGWTLEQLRVEAARGVMAASGQGTLERIDATAELDLPRLDRLPAQVRALGVPRLAGAVKLSAHASGPLAGPLAVRSTVRLRELAAFGVKLRRADLTAKLRGLPAAPAGELHLALEGLDPGDPRLRVDRAELRVSGSPQALRLDTRVSGPSLRARLLADTRIARRAERVETFLRELRLEGLGQKVELRNQPRVVYQPAQIELGATRLALLGGELTASGVFRPRGFPRAVASLRLEGVRPPGFPHRVHATVEARLDRREARADLTGELRALGSRLELHARLPIRYRGSAPAPDLTGAGEVRLRASGLKLALAKQLRKELPAVSGEATLALDLKGPLRDPDLELDLQLADVTLDRIRGVGTSTRLTVAGGKSSLRQRVSLGGRPLVALDAALPLTLGPFLGGGAPGWEPLRALPVELHLVVPPTALASLPPVHPVLKQLAGQASARVDLTGSLALPKLALRAQLAGAALEGRKLGDLELDAELAAEQQRVLLKLDARRDRLALCAVRGSVGLKLDTLLPRPPATLPPIPLEVRVELPGYPLDRLATLDPALQGLRGRLSGELRLGGDSRAPRVTGALQVARLGYDRLELGELQLTTSLAGALLEAGVALRLPEGGELRGGGKLLSFHTLDAFVRGRRLDLSFLPRVATAVQESAGKVELDIKATGSVTRPVLTGRIALDDASLHLRGVSPLHHLRATVELEPDRVRLSRLGLRADKGQLDATGLVELHGRGLDLARGAGMLRHAELVARAKGFGLDAGGVTGVVFGGTVKVDARNQSGEGRSGATKGDKLAVTVDVEQGVVKMPKIKGQQTHSTSLPPDIVFVDPRAGKAGGRRGEARAAASKPPLGLQLALRADPIFVRGEQLDLELANTLLVRTDRQGRPRVAGRIMIRRGRIWVLKNTFEVRRATVRLSGEADADPALDILLERAAPEAMVLVAVTGTARKPELSLQSDPPIYDQSQIMSLLLTGRVDSRPDSSAGDQSVAIASAISGALLGSVLQSVAPSVGLDVARVSFDESKDKKTGAAQLRAEAEVGRYLTERLYLGYRRVFGASAQENANEGLLEYRISAHWLLTALFGDAGVGGLDVLWNLRH